MTLGDIGTTGDASARVLIVADRSSDLGDTPGARQMACSAALPVLEPADADDAVAMIAAGVALVEEFACPVLIRLCDEASAHWGHPHAQWPAAAVVETAAGAGLPGSLFPSAPPRSAPGGDVLRQARSRELANWADLSPLNVLERGRGTRSARRIGFIAAGPAYHRVRAAYPGAAVLRIGTPHPLPLKHVRGITEMCRVVLVVEQGEPFIESELRAEGFRVYGAALLTRCGGIGSPALTDALEALAHAAGC